MLTFIGNLKSLERGKRLSEDTLEKLYKTFISTDFVNFGSSISKGYNKALLDPLFSAVTVTSGKAIVLNDTSFQVYNWLTDLGFKHEDVYLVFGKWNNDATPTDDLFVYYIMKRFAEVNFEEFKNYSANIITIKEMFNLDNKINLVIANPPYDKNLHLKILSTLNSTFLNEKSTTEIVSLQPIRWLQDNLASIKKRSDYSTYEDSVSKYITDLKVIPAREAQVLFDIVLPMDLGIYRLTANGGFDYKALSTNSILNKVFEHLKNNHPIFDENKKDGWRVRLPYMTGGKSNGSGHRKASLKSFGKLLYFLDGKKDGKKWYEFFNKNQWSKTTDEITRSVHMNSERECVNFINQFECKFVKYITDLLITDVHVREEQFLWMSNTKNPRTGLVGYLSDWTDEDFYTFFNITDEEKKLINARIAEFEEG